jgi:2-hydroxy-6-oxonona-2,4-dienedioate hydrolase
MHTSATNTALRGVPIHAVEAGEGDPVVLLHPLPGHSGSFARVLPLLAELHHVLAPDLRGNGSSGKPRGDYSVPTQAEVLIEWLETRGIGRASFVGNSYGGILALYLACHTPDRVAALVLSGTNAYTAFRFPLEARILSSALGAWLVPCVRRTMLERSYLEQFHDPSLVGREHLDALWRPLQEPNGLWCLWKQSHQIDFGLLEPHLRRVAAPALLVWGREDRGSPLRWAEHLLMDLPHARLAVIERCGHYPPLERPQEFSRLTLEFLAATERERGCSAGPEEMVGSP